MTTGSFSYLVKHGFASLWLNRLMSFASIVILTACLIITGGAGIIMLNVRAILSEVEGQNQMSVFVSMDANDDEVAVLRQQIKEIDYVESTKYLSKRDVFEQELAKQGPDAAELFEGLDPDNTFPATIIVTLSDISQTRSVSDRISQFENVDGVSESEQVAVTLTGIEKTFFVIGAIIVGILIIASVLVISNTIKLSIFARRKEINIMRYVGATNAFVRLPFVIEGILIGIISALLAFAAIWGIMYAIDNLLSDYILPWISGISGAATDFEQIWYWVLGSFGVAGVLIGAMSSSAALNRHLKV